MLNQLSPGVNFSEIDNTTRAPAVSTSVGAFVGNFRWGPVDEATTVVSEPDLVSRFGAPTVATTVDFHIAANFLSYSRNLQVIRVVTDGANNANAGGDDATVVRNETDRAGQIFTLPAQGHWIAKYPGIMGNSITVSTFSFATDTATTQTNFDNWIYSSSFEAPVGTSSFAAARGSSNDEIHIAVIDTGGEISGTPGTVLEVFPFLSQASDARTETGASSYYANVINTQSRYIWFGATDSTNFTQAGNAASGSLDFAGAQASGVVTMPLTGGVDSSALTPSEYAEGVALFSDSATADVSILIAPNLSQASATPIANNIIATAEARRDMVATISPPAGADTETEIRAFYDTLQSSTYSVKDTGRMMQYDKYNDTLVEVPINGSVAGLMAETDRIRGSWFSPAGFRRGQIRNVTKLVFNPNQAERDSLYNAGINPIVTFPGEGTVLFGDRTGTSRPSAFRNINVRRLFITVEKSISIAARDVLFEFNNEFTRNQFINIVEPLLRTIQGRNGITQFAVICDETNNPGDVVDRNEFVADIFIQPARSTNFIQLNFIATRTGADFNTIVGNN